MDEIFIKYERFASRDVTIQLKSGKSITGYLDVVFEADEIDENEVSILLIVDGNDVEILDHEIESIKEIA